MSRTFGAAGHRTVCETSGALAIQLEQLFIARFVHQIIDRIR